MAHADLRDFLILGQFGDVAPRCSCKKMVEELGFPDGRETRAMFNLHGKVGLVKYGSLQATFARGEVSNLGIYFGEPFRLPIGMQWHGMDPMQPYSIPEFQTLISSIGIEMIAEDRLGLDPKVSFRVASGVARINFTETEYSSEPVLYSLYI